MSEKKPIDWSAVHAEYRLDVYSNRELADRHGCSEAGVRKRARLEKWEKDLSARVQEAVRSKMVGIDGSRGVRSTASRVGESALVDNAAGVIVEVQLRHRKDLLRLRNFIDRQLVRIEQIEEEEAEQEKLRKALEADADKKTGAQEEWDSSKLLKLIAFKADIFETIARAQHRLIPLERQAYNMDAGDAVASSESQKLVRDMITQIRDRTRDRFESEPDSVNATE